MSDLYGATTPVDWTYKTYKRQAVDTPEVMRMKYIGSEAAAHVTLAATTGDMTFEQGASTGAAVVGTGTNPGSSGVMDISDYSTVKEVVDGITYADDWEAWYSDYLCDNDIEVTAGNAIYLTTLADQDCTGENGFAVLVDTSLETAEIFPVGVTLQGPSSTIGAQDHQVVHEVTYIAATVTYGGATSGIYVYEVDDIAGTKTEIDILPLVTATATTWGDGSYVLYQTKGKRLVFQAVDASGAITSPDIRITARSMRFGPATNKKKLFSNY